MLIVLVQTASYAQYESSIWFWSPGSAGVKFDLSTQQPSPYNVSQPLGTEGCFVATHPRSGELLYYTDGIKVYDKTHNSIDNGLNGNASGANTVVSCQKPGNEDFSLFYVISNSGNYLSGGHLYLSIVDMRLGTNGDVVASTKNTPINASGNPYGNAPYSSTEATMLVAKPCSDEFWLVNAEQNSNRIHVFDVTDTGIYEISTSPFALGSGRFDLAYNSAYSIASKKLALNARRLSSGLQGVYTYDFDDTNGEVTNRQLVYSTFMVSYGMSFSPDGSKLYYCETTGNIPNVTVRLRQFDLNTSTHTTIHTTPSGDNYINGIRLAPNGYLYVAQHNLDSLHAIKSPDSTAIGNLCQFVRSDYAIDTTPVNSTLPTFLTPRRKISIVDSAMVPINRYIQLCFGDSLFVMADTPIYTYQWSTGDTTVSIYLNDTGTYILVATTATNCKLSDTVTVAFVPIPHLGGDSTLTDSFVCKSDSIELRIDNSYDEIYWSTGDTTNSIWVNETDTYWVRVKTAECTYFDSLNVTFYHDSLINLGSDTLICPGDSITLTVDSSDINYLWSTSETTQSITVKDSGVYYVDAYFPHGCVISDTVRVNIFNTSSLFLGPDTIICKGDSITLSPGNFSSYTWSTGDTSETITIDSPGTYWVSVTIGNCMATDSVVIGQTGDLNINLGNDTSICPGDSLILSVDTPGLTYLWSTNNILDSITVKDSGLVWVQVTDGVGCSASDTIRVTLVPSSITLGNDTTICDGDSIALTPGNGFTTYSWSTGQNSDTIYAKVADTFWVEVVSGGCTFRDTVVISIAPQLQLGIGSDTLLCAGETVVLTVNPAALSYSWSSSSLDTNSISVSVPDTYSVMATYGNGCLAYDTIIVAIASMDSLSLGPDTTLCDNSSLTLDPGPFPTIIWQDSLVQRIFPVDQSGTYHVMVTDSIGCTYRDTIEVGIFDESAFSQPQTIEICQGSSVTLSLPALPGITYNWEGGEQGDDFTVFNEGVYTVTTVACGKTLSKEYNINVAVEEGNFYYIPNAFSPILDDAINDRFGIIVDTDILNVLEFKMLITNRWGEILYTTTDIEKHWDGKRDGRTVPPGVFVYSIRMIIDQPCYGERAVNLEGTVTVF
ncbi:MAG: gliding motility-associated C-terminal domain-containing protein [Bacteroidia bacterium]